MMELVVFDFDGVMSCGSVGMTEKGEVRKFYHVRDGVGIKRLMKRGTKVAVASGYKWNESQRKILAHLGIEHYKFSLNPWQKFAQVKAWMKQFGIEDTKRVAFMGDDVNDIPAMSFVGFSACPSDAHIKCRESAQYVSPFAGGRGCVRDMCDYICDRHEKRRVSVLDCTFRDGGIVTNWMFPEYFVEKYLEVVAPVVDIVELGYIANKPTPGMFGNLDMTRIAGFLGRNDSLKFATYSVMGDYGKFSVQKHVPDNKDGKIPVSLVRVVVKSKDLLTDSPNVQRCIRSIQERGYECALNLSNSSHVNSWDSIGSAIAEFKTKPSILYVADSFGNLKPAGVRRIFSVLRSYLPKVKFGFHGHNNGQMALANALSAERYAEYVDCTVRGFGKGAGNLPLELYLAQCRRKNLGALLDFAETMMRDIAHRNNFFGYSVKNVVTGARNATSRFAQYWKESRASELDRKLDSLSMSKRDRTEKPEERVCCLIPARYKSSRIPHKMLMTIDGVPLFAIVATRAAECKSIDRVIVVTDHHRIESEAKARGFEVMRIDGPYANGTERIAAAAETLETKYQCYVNVQGDEFDVEPRNVDDAIDRHLASQRYCTCMHARINPDSGPSHTKVVLNNRSEIMYISRAVIPHGATDRVHMHQGVYVFSPQALRDFTAYGPGKAQKTEGIEILKLVEQGRVVHSELVPRPFIQVNTMADVERIRKTKHVKLFKI